MSAILKLKSDGAQALLAAALALGCAVNIALVLALAGHLGERSHDTVALEVLRRADQPLAQADVPPGRPGQGSRRVIPARAQLRTLRPS